MNTLREVHQIQVRAEDVGAALRELARDHEDVPPLVGLELRARLDALTGEKIAERDREGGHVLHRVEDPTRTGKLALYRNRQSLYQFTEIGFRAYQAVEEIVGVRVEDAALSRLAFADLLADLMDLAAANRRADGEEVYRRLVRLDRVLDDMSNRAARFALTLNDVVRTTDTSPEVFLQFKNALLVHLSDFAAELERYRPRLAKAVEQVEATGLETLLERAAEADERPLLSPQARREDWRRRWRGLRQWFVTDPGAVSRADQLQEATRQAIAGVISLLRHVTEARRSGVSRPTQLRHLAAWVAGAPDQEAANALIAAAFDLRSARHLSGAHDDGDQISSRSTWWDAPGVEVSVSLFRHGRRPGPGGPKPVRNPRGARAVLREEQLARRAAEREAAADLVARGAHGRLLSPQELRAVQRLLTLALETRATVTGRLAPATAAGEAMTLRLVPDAAGSQLRTADGTLHLPGFVLEIGPARSVRRTTKGS